MGVSKGLKHITAQGTQHLKFSLRLNGRVTSLTIKKNIITLWFLFGTDYIEAHGLEDQDWAKIELQTVMDVCTDFISLCTEEWEFDNGKGLSEFITEKMIKEFLDKEDYRLYSLLMQDLNKPKDH